MNKVSSHLISVVSPAYNEAEIIEDVVREWIETLNEREGEWEIVICDDGSDDGTDEVLRSLDEPRLKVVRLDRNHGYGPALSEAMAAASGGYLVTIDSDGQFDLGDFPSLLGKLKEGNDIVTGYRRKKEDTPLKVVGDRILNLIVRITFGLSLADTNCALKVMKREVARAVKIEAVGFPTPTEIVVRAAHMGFRVAEAPVNHKARPGGKSKLNVLRGGFEFILFLCYLRLQLFLEKWKLVQRKQT